MTYARIAGTGGYLPERVLTNDDFATRLDTSDEWIRERTGIKRRHIAADDEVTSDLAANAAQRALDAAGVSAEEIDLIVQPPLVCHRRSNQGVIGIGHVNEVSLEFHNGD